MVGIMTKPVERTGYDDLVVQAKSQAAALGRLYELYYDRILRFCVHRLFNRALAEDVTSSVFLTVARTMRRFDGRTERDFRAWIYTIAANQANAHIRKSTRRRRLLETALGGRGADDQETPDPSRLDWPRLYEAIRGLKPDQQTILTLRFFEGMDYDEIAGIVNARPGTVRVTLHRALRRLQETLQEDLGGDQ
jgi:RNA polymerase sigma-70 factor (ECF subfamily)